MKRFHTLVAGAVTALIIAAPLSAYILKRQLTPGLSIVENKWNSSTPIVWQMDAVRGTNIQGTRSHMDVFRAAVAAWQGLPTSGLSLTAGTIAASNLKPGIDGVNLFTTNLTSAEYLQLCPPNTLACTIQAAWEANTMGPNGPVFAGELDEADILFSPATAYSTDLMTPANQFDLQSVMTHEVGHLAGLEHTTMVSAAMFWTMGAGATYGRVPSTDDVAGISALYPTAAFLAKGSLSGTVRLSSNAPVYGAIVTAMNANGQPVASAITDPSGRYTIAGLDAGIYSVYAEPLDQPIVFNNVPTLATIYPGAVVNTNFITRFR